MLACIRDSLVRLYVRADDPLTYHMAAGWWHSETFTADFAVCPAVLSGRQSVKQGGLSNRELRPEHTQTQLIDRVSQRSSGFVTQ